MRIRRSVGLIAIVGVLLHALAIVRHHAVVMADALPPSPSAEDGLRADSTFFFGKLPLCRGNPIDITRDGESGESGPSKSQRSAPCPVCSGSVAAFAVAPSVFAVLVLPRTGLPQLPDQHEHPLQAERCAHPPARGPPATA